MADDDTPASIAKRAAAMVKAKGAKESAENLNRASLAISRGEEATDFTDMLETAASGGRRSPATGAKARRPAAAPGGEHTPQQPMPPANKNTPPETPKAGDGPGPSRTNASAQQTATTAYRGDGTIQTPLTHDRKSSRTVNMPDYDAMGNPLGTQSPVTHVSPGSTPRPVQGPPVPTASGPVPVSEYIDGMVEEQAPPAPPATVMPPPVHHLQLEDRVPPGSVAPVQSNPVVAPAAVATPPQAPPVAADAAQRPKIDVESLMNSPGFRATLPMLMGGRSPGASVPRPAAMGAPGAAPPVGMAPPGLPPPQAALPSSYGPPMPRGNPNMATPPPTIPMQPGGTQAHLMPKPRGTVRAGSQRQQDNMIANTEALVRALRARGPGARP